MQSLLNSIWGRLTFRGTRARISEFFQLIRTLTSVVAANSVTVRENTTTVAFDNLQLQKIEAHLAYLKSAERHRRNAAGLREEF